MIRFEEASQSPMHMSVCVSFCIAGYLEQSGIHKFTDDELKKFMSETGTDIEKWLEEESEVSDGD